MMVERQIECNACGESLKPHGVMKLFQCSLCLALYEIKTTRSGDFVIKTRVQPKVIGKHMIPIPQPTVSEYPPDYEWSEPRHGELLFRSGLVIEHYKVVVIVDENGVKLCFAPLGCGADDLDFIVDEHQSQFGCER